jgi:peptidoglycan/xylan/chitin deacetylase (PgdA/CDA1 family)
MFGNFQKFPAIDNQPTKGKVVYLRHDIDGKLMNAWRMAYLEAELGIKSTYFALNHSNYWESPDTFKLLREIQEMGHEIAWHQCVIVQHHITPSVPIRSLIEEPLKRLRDEGLIIRGTSPHGSAYGGEKNINSWQIWKEYRFPYNGLPVFPLADFGLEYEAMFLNRDDYHSDSSAMWCGEPKDIVKKYNEELNYILQINIHPQHWI